MTERCVLIILILALGIGMLKSQDKYPVRGTVFVRGSKALKVSLSIMLDQKSTLIPVDIDGNFTTYLDWNKNYQFYFSKPGYVGKKINFSTVVPGNIEKKNIYPYEILVELFATFPNADTTFFKNPVAKIAYSNKANDFEYDLDYFLIVKNKINSFNKQYNAWREQAVPQIPITNNSITKTQEATALIYQKNVETRKSKVAASTKSVVTHNIKVPVIDNENQFGLPPLKESYSDGKFIEVYPLKAKVITRVVIKNGAFQKVFYKVEHNWGGQYYFVEESPEYYRSISKYNFEKATKG